MRIIIVAYSLRYPLCRLMPGCPTLDFLTVRHKKASNYKIKVIIIKLPTFLFEFYSLVSLVLLFRLDFKFQSFAQPERDGKRFAPFIKHLNRAQTLVTRDIKEFCDGALTFINQQNNVTRQPTGRTSDPKLG